MKVCVHGHPYRGSGPCHDCYVARWKRRNRKRSAQSQFVRIELTTETLHRSALPSPTRMPDGTWTALIRDVALLQRDEVKRVRFEHEWAFNDQAIERAAKVVGVKVGWKMMAKTGELWLWRVK